MIHSSKLFESLYEGVRLTCQELVQGLSVHVPAFSLLDVVDNLEGLICFGSNHHACEGQGRQQGVQDNVAWSLACVCQALCLVGYRTWCGESVLPSRFVVIQGLQHDIHGESKQATQENVEDYIEEKDKTCGQRGRRV